MKSILVLITATALVAIGMAGCNRTGSGTSETPKTTGMAAPSVAPGVASGASQ
jgi:hypothetical protein